MKKTFSVFWLLLALATLATAQDAKRLYPGVRLGGSVGMVYPVGNHYFDYFGDDKDPDAEWRDGGSFDIAPFVSLQINDKFAFQTEVMITRFGYYGAENRYTGTTYQGNPYELHTIERVSRRALVIPILSKYTLRRNRFHFQLYAGPHFTANVGKYRYFIYEKEVIGDKKDEEEITFERNRFFDGDLTYPPVGLTIGTNFGFITTKAGTFFIDARLLGDFGTVKIGRGEEHYLYRAKLSFSLGYEFGFIDR